MTTTTDTAVAATPGHVEAIAEALELLVTRLNAAGDACHEILPTRELGGELHDFASLSTAGAFAAAAFVAEEWTRWALRTATSWLASRGGDTGPSPVPVPAATPAPAPSAVPAPRAIRMDGVCGWDPVAAHTAILQLRAASAALAAAGYGKTVDAATNRLNGIADAVRTALHDTLRHDGQQIPAEWIADEPIKEKAK